MIAKDWKTWFIPLALVLMARAGAAWQDDGAVVVKGWGYPTDEPVPPGPADWVVDQWYVLQASEEERDLVWNAVGLNREILQSLAYGSLVVGDRDYAWVPMDDADADLVWVCAVSRFTPPDSEPRMLHAEGVHTLFVNGMPYQGDLQCGAFRGSPIDLGGDTHILVAAEPSPDFRVRFWKPRAHLVIADWGARPFGLTREEWGNPFIDLSVPIYNVSRKEDPYVHFHYGEPVGESYGERGVNEWRCGIPIPAMGTMDFSCHDMASSGMIQPEDRTATYSLLTFGTGGPLGVHRKITSRVVPESIWKSTPKGIFIQVGSRWPAEDAGVLGLDPALQLARWFQQRDLHDRGAWSTILSDEEVASRYTPWSGSQHLFIGNDQTLPEMTYRLLKWRKQRNSGATTLPIPSKVELGRMEWHGRVFEGNDWHFVFRPNQDECFVFLTGAEAVPALAKAWSAAPYSYSTLAPSR